MRSFRFIDQLSAFSLNHGQLHIYVYILPCIKKYLKCPYDKKQIQITQETEGNPSEI